MLAVAAVFSTAAIPANAAVWSAASPWAYDELSKANSEGLIPAGFAGKDFTKPAARAEFCELVVFVYEKIKGEITGRLKFDDVKDENVEKAAAIGVINGVGGGRFDPEASLTREQAAVMLSRLAEAAGKPFEKKTASFADADRISAWAAAEVGQIQAAKIMGGKGENKFAPQDLYTREECVITVLRMYEALKSEAGASRLLNKIYGMINSGMYHIKMRIKSGKIETTAELYGKNGMFAVKTNIFGTTVYKDGKQYDIIDMLKTVRVTSWDPDGKTETEFIPDESDLIYIGEGTGEFFGGTYKYEEYVTKEGVRTFFYADGNDFIGIRAAEKNGAVTDMKILAFDWNVPDSVFEIPDGYKIAE